MRHKGNRGNIRSLYVQTRSRRFESRHKLQRGAPRRHICVSVRLGREFFSAHKVLSKMYPIYKTTPCRFHTLQGAIVFVLPNLVNMANPTAEVIISVMGYVSQK